MSPQEHAPDVQAAVTVLGRGGFADAVSTWLKLRRVDLRKQTSPTPGSKG